MTRPPVYPTRRRGFLPYLAVFLLIALAGGFYFGRLLLRRGPINTAVPSHEPAIQGAETFRSVVPGMLCRVSGKGPVRLNPNEARPGGSPAEGKGSGPAFAVELGTVVLVIRYGSFYGSMAHGYSYRFVQVLEGSHRNRQGWIPVGNLSPIS